jgi:hypothetical protein
MKWFTPVSVLLAAFLAVFWEALFGGVRRIVGAQVDLLPPLMVYASLNAGLLTLTALAVLGGLWFDSLSANPLGVSVLPLFVIGLAIFSCRELILEDQVFAQFVLGLAASAITPMITLLLLLSTGYAPLIGWGTAWQLLVMAVGGAIAAPIIFELFRLLNRTLGYRQVAETSFRLDREIRRGR